MCDVLIDCARHSPHPTPSVTQLIGLGDQRLVSRVRVAELVMCVMLLNGAGGSKISRVCDVINASPPYALVHAAFSRLRFYNKLCGQLIVLKLFT